MNRPARLILAMLLALWGPGALAQGALAAPLAADSSDVARAERVQQWVQQRFWDSQRRLYIGRTGQHGPAMIWSAGIALSALNGACRHDPATYRPILLSYFQSLQRYWDRNEPGGGYEPLPTDGSGHDKYYDDNAWIAIALVESSRITGEGQLFDRARQTTDFVLTGWDDRQGGGIWWQERHKAGTKNTCSNAPAAVAALAVAERLGSTQPAESARDRAAARRIVQWTREHLQNADGRFADRIVVDTGQVIHPELTYNTAMMIRAQWMLGRDGGSADDQLEAEREAWAADAFVDPRTGQYRDAIRWSHLLVEADLNLAAATRDPHLADHLRRQARVAVAADYAAWLAKPSDQLLDAAALARELWLLAESPTAGS